MRLRDPLSSGCFRAFRGDSCVRNRLRRNGYKGGATGPGAPTLPAMQAASAQPPGRERKKARARKERLGCFAGGRIEAVPGKLQSRLAQRHSWAGWITAMISAAPCLRSDAGACLNTDGESLVKVPCPRPRYLAREGGPWAPLLRAYLPLLWCDGGVGSLAGRRSK